MATVKLTRKADDGSVTDHSIAFIKTEKGWRADYHLPEKEAARATAREAGKKLELEARRLAESWGFDQARSKLVEAQKLSPEDEELKKAIAAIDEVLAGRVAGRWMLRVQKDAMTDKENVYATLPATADLAAAHTDKRPRLVARCVKGEPDVLFSINAVVDGDIYSKAKVQYRFDAEPPQPLVMTTADHRQGVFFPEASKWLDRLAQHSSGKLTVEIPLFGRVAEATSFDLSGADKAIAEVKRACTK